MSNVIRSSSSYSAADQPAVIGKIYEELYTDASDNTVTRYIRCFKASGAVSKGDLIGAASANVRAMYSEGTAAKAPAGGLSRPKIYGVAIADVADGEYGFCVCRGIFEDAAANAASVGALLQSHTVAGQVDAITPGAGDSQKVIGMALAAASGNKVNMYVDVL